MSKWSKFWKGVKVAVGLLAKAQDKGLVKIKELPKIEAGVAIVDDAVEDAKKRP